MKFICTVFAALMTFPSFSQSDSLAAINEIQLHQKQLNKEFADKRESPLTEEDRKKFKQLPFFSINLTYRVEATLERTENTDFFGLKTTTSRIAMERIFGYLHFAIEGKQFKIPVYQSRDLMTKPGYEDYLFFPFTDLTNGTETYGGGRYLDLRIPKEGDKIIIDFNKAYNPYCAYSDEFSCPKVPAENHLDIEVRAGVTYTKK